MRSDDQFLQPGRRRKKITSKFTLDARQSPRALRGWGVGRPAQRLPPMGIPKPKQSSITRRPTTSTSRGMKLSDTAAPASVVRGARCDDPDPRLILVRAPRALTHRPPVPASRNFLRSIPIRRLPSTTCRSQSKLDRARR